MVMTFEIVLTEIEIKKKIYFCHKKSKFFTETPQMVDQRYMNWVFFSQGSLIF